MVQVSIEAACTVTPRSARIRIDALPTYTEDQTRVSTLGVKRNHGRTGEALGRLCHEYVDHWHEIAWAYRVGAKESASSWTRNGKADLRPIALNVRGHEDGSIGRRLPNAWLQEPLWAPLHSGWEYARQEKSGHEY